MASLFVKQNAIFLLCILNMFQSNNFVILTHLMLKDVYSYDVRDFTYLCMNKLNRTKICSYERVFGHIHMM